MVEKTKLKEISDYIIDNIRHTIEEFGERPPGSEGETKAINYMEETVKPFVDETKIEPFKVAPKAFMGFIPIIGVILLVSIFLYWFYPLISLLLDLLVLFIMLQEFIRYKQLLDPFFPKSTSHNLIGIIKPKGEVKQRLIFGGHADAAYEWRYHKGETSLLRLILIPAVLGLFLKTGIDLFAAIFNFGWTEGYFSFWGILGIIQLIFIPIVILIIRFSDFNSMSPGAADNLSGAWLAIALVKYLKEQNIQFENTELMLLNTGSEEAGLRGAKAFIKKHKNELKELDTIYICLETFRDFDDLSVLVADLNGTVKHDPRVIDLIKEAAKDNGYDLEEQTVYIGAADAAAFTQAGIPTSGIEAMDPGPPRYYHTRHDTWQDLTANTLEAGFQITLRAFELYDEKGIPKKL